MLISLCGTPGTGKTTVSGLLRKRDFEVVGVNDLVLSLCKGAPAEDGSGEIEVDIDRLRSDLSTWSKGVRKRTLLEGHLSYLAPCDLCLLLRVDPNVILQRGSDRGYPKEKSRENAEAEGIGYLLHECMEEERKALNGADWSCLPPSGRIVLELDVTPLDPTEVAEWVARMAEGFEGKRLNELSPYRPGRIDWIEVLSGWF